MAANTVLTGAGFSYNALFAQSFGKQSLSDAVIDFMCAGVIQLVALEIDFCAAKMFGHALGQIERAGSTDIMLEQTIQLGFEARISFGVIIGLFQIQNQRHQGFSDKTPAKNTEMACLIRPCPVGIGRCFIHFSTPARKCSRCA